MATFNDDLCDGLCKPGFHEVSCPAYLDWQDRQGVEDMLADEDDGAGCVGPYGKRFGGSNAPPGYQRSGSP